MRRIVVAVVLALLALTPLALDGSTHFAAFRPAFLETDRGIDPFVSTCKMTGRTPVVTANTNLIQGDTQVQLGQAAGCWTPQNEPTIAVDPSNPLHLIAGANDYRLCCDRTGHNDGTGWAYISGDGGKTWTNRLLPMLTLETGGHGFLANVDSAGDPSVAFTRNSIALYANITFRRGGNYSAITLSRSTDGGHHWHNPQVLAQANDPALFLDKEWVATGPDHLVAVTFTVFDSSYGLFGSSRIYARISHDDGVSFGPPVEVAPGHMVAQGSAPGFAPDGTLYVAYETVDFQYGVDVEAYSTSRPPYPSFHPYQLAEAWDDCYPKNTDGRATLTGLNFRTNSLPSLAVDPVSGSVAIVWTDDQAGCGQDQTSSQLRVVFAHRAHHSDPITVTNGADKTMPAAVFRDSMLTVGFYTRSFADFPNGIDYGYVSSRDGYVEHRVSDGSSDTFTEFRGAFAGDYTSAAEGSNGVVHLAWQDSRGGDQNVLTQAVSP